MNTIVGISTAVSTLAMVGVFIFTWLNFSMIKKIQVKHDEDQDRFQDLLEAVVIASLLTGPGHSTSNFFENGKRYFNSAYKGKTKIFKE